MVDSERLEHEKIVEGYAMFLEFTVNYQSKPVEEVYQLFLKTHSHKLNITSFAHFF